jgi:hypothetical protein
MIIKNCLKLEHKTTSGRKQEGRRGQWHPMSIVIGKKCLLIQLRVVHLRMQTKIPGINVWVKSLTQNSNKDLLSFGTCICTINLNSLASQGSSGFFNNFFYCSVSGNHPQ